MISTKKLVKMAKKWQKFAVIQRKRILFTKEVENVNDDRFASSNPSASSTKGDNGCFVVYSADQQRFIIPLHYLYNELFNELLKMSEEEFGLPSEGPIILPVDGRNLDYIIAMIQRGLAGDIQKALLMSVAIPCSLPSQNNEDPSTSGRSSLPSVAKKGHFVAYTSDGRRYSIPIAYLKSSIFRKLLKMSEEEYGIPKAGPITFPCISIFMDYIISLTPRKTTKDVEEALLLSVAANKCLSGCTVYQQETSQHALLYGF